MDNILAWKIQLRHNIDPCKPTGSTSMQGRKNTETSWKKKVGLLRKKVGFTRLSLTSDLGPRTSDLRLFPCFSFLAWMLSLLVYMGLCCVSLDLPCQDVVHTSPPCWVYVGSAAMTLGLGWVLCLGWICLYVGLCWIC